MPADPFRIQLLTLALDSQAVLAVLGLAVAGLVFRQAAPRVGLTHLGAGAWWDLVTAAVIAGRVVWVALHLDYYARAPLQTIVITDGGLHPIGLVLGAAYAIRRLAGASPAPHARRPILHLVALSVMVSVLLERTGCALTTCGGGSPTDLPWALRRGEELRHPVALYQVAILALALLLTTGPPRLAERAFPTALAALALVEVVGLAWGSGGFTGLAALLLAGALSTTRLMDFLQRRAPNRFARARAQAAEST